MVKKLFIKQSLMGYALKIAGLVVMAWGVIQGIFSLVMMAQMGGHMMNEWGEIQYSSGMTGATLFAFVGIVATHFLYGLLVIGFGEVIDLLQKIYFRLHPEAEQEWMEEQKEQEERNTTYPDGDVPFWVRSDLKPFYEKKELAIKSIEKTEDPYVFKVNLEDRSEYVAMGNEGPRILSDEETLKYK